MAETGAAARGRPRSTEVDRRIAAAVLGLLHDGGPGAVTMEAVAARSGVAKTSIYRRYPDRAAALRAVLGSALARPAEVADGPVRDRVRRALQQAWRQMAEVLGPGGLAALVREEDPEFSRLFRDALAPYEDGLVEMIEQDVAAGRLRAEVDADAAVTLLVGAYLGELVRRGDVGEDRLERVVDLMLVALTGTP